MMFDHLKLVHIHTVTITRTTLINCKSLQICRIKVFRDYLEVHASERKDIRLVIPRLLFMKLRRGVFALEARMGSIGCACLPGTKIKSNTKVGVDDSAFMDQNVPRADISMPNRGFVDEVESAGQISNSVAEKTFNVIGQASVIGIELTQISVEISSVSDWR